MQMQINIGHNFSIFLISMLLTAFLDYSPKQMLSHIVVKLIIVLLCEKFLQNQKENWIINNIKIEKKDYENNYLF